MKVAIVSGLAVAGIVLLSAAAYAALVRPVVVAFTVYPPLSSIAHVEADYRYGGQAAYWFFWPAHKIDERLRPQLWEPKLTN